MCNRLSRRWLIEREARFYRTIVPPDLAIYLTAPIETTLERNRNREKVEPEAELERGASGLLSGRYTRETTFAADDHRTYNRNGEQFDVGETFAGVDFETGVDAAQHFAGLVPDGATPAQTALRWIIDQPGVTAVIPGARSVEQARGNAAAGELPPLDDGIQQQITALYEERIRPLVHDRW